MIHHARTMFAVGGVVVFLAACGANGAETEDIEQTELRLGHVYELEYPVHSCGAGPLEEHFEDDDEIELSVYPTSQLGSEREMVDQVASGELELVFAGPSQLAEFHEPLAVFDTPYLFEDVDALIEAVESTEAHEMYEELVDQGNMRVIDVWLYGTRHVTADRPIQSPEDMEGLSIRVQEAPVYLETAEAFSASPTSVSLDEVYLALQQGLVEAAEGPAVATSANGFDEVAEYFSVTSHIQSSIPVVINENVWQNLSDAAQERLVEGLETYRDGVRDCLEEQDQEAMDDWQQTGTMEVVDDVDLEAFQDAAWDHFSDGFVYSDLYREWAPAGND